MTVLENPGCGNLFGSCVENLALQSDVLNRGRKLPVILIGIMLYFKPLHVTCLIQIWHASASTSLLPSRLYADMLVGHTSLQVEQDELEIGEII
jgi:hypothetical protein